MSHSDTREKWDQAWSNLEAQPWYPDEQFVRFLARYISRRTGFDVDDVSCMGESKPAVLDIGCGKGRHVVTLAELGIDAYGCDISEVAVAFARKWLESRDLNGEIVRSDLGSIPFESGLFDAVACHGVLDHMLESDRSAGVVEVQRLLKPGGYFFFSVISGDDSAYGNGDFIEEKTWSVSEGFEKNIPQAFFDIPRIEREFGSFELVNITHTSVENITGRSLIGTDKHYDKDGRYYVLARRW